MAKKVASGSASPCCGKLFYAEVIKDTVVLECCGCAKLWRLHPDGTLVALSRRDKARIRIVEPEVPTSDAPFCGLKVLKPAI